MRWVNPCKCFLQKAVQASVVDFVGDCREFVSELLHLIDCRDGIPSVFVANYGISLFVVGPDFVEELVTFVRGGPQSLDSLAAIVRWGSISATDAVASSLPPIAGTRR